jgi:hypothetical protein
MKRVNNDDLYFVELSDVEDEDAIMHPDENSYWSRKMIMTTTREWAIDRWAKKAKKTFYSPIKESPSAPILKLQYMLTFRDTFEATTEWRYAGWYMFTMVYWDLCPHTKYQLMLMWRKLVEHNKDNWKWSTYFCLGHPDRKRLMRWETMIWGFDHATVLPIKFVENHAYGTYDWRKLIAVK